MGLGNCCLLVLAILIPPLAVILQGGCTIHLCINLLCCLLGVVPGISTRSGTASTTKATSTTTIITTGITKHAPYPTTAQPEAFESKGALTRDKDGHDSE
ncbi:hypothetical protein AAVH_06411 [Aphelenchoides avenae]|nr:hypothetical protein AAVH_06411 [Aphelenchus avenae]